MHDATAWVAIIGMALATYVSRIGGMILVSRGVGSPRVEAFLRAVPGSVIASIVAPAVLTSGPAEALAGLAVLIVSARTRNILLSMITGIGAVWLLRHVL